MIIKKKSLVVAAISGFIISCVLVLTLVGYVMYMELKAEEFKRTYQDLLQKLNVKLYSRYIDITKLNATLEAAGPLKGNPVIAGVIKNNGTRDIKRMLLKVKFLDQDGAIIYEIVFHPQEPSLGSSSLTQVTIPYLSNLSKIVITPGAALPFKKILTNCPQELFGELQKGSGFSKGTSRWSGKLSFEILALEL